MKQTISVSVLCIECNSKLPNKISNVDIESADNLIGLSCPTCSHTFTDNDTTAMLNFAIEKGKKEAAELAKAEVKAMIKKAFKK